MSLPGKVPSIDSSFWSGVLRVSKCVSVTLFAMRLLLSARWDQSLAAVREAVSRHLPRFLGYYPPLTPPQLAPTSQKPSAENCLPPPVAATFKLRAAHLFDAGPQPWRTEPWARPQIPSMICPDEIDFLHYLARTQYRNRGSIIEFGPLGGVSTCALALGAPEAILHAYDFWIYHDSLRDYFPGRYLRLGQSVLPAFLENIRPFRDRVRVHRGDLTRQRWASGPIEIVFVDAAKTPASLLHMFREFFPWVVPQGWIVWQDYVSATCPWIHLALEELADYFEYWDSPEGGTVVTRLKCPLPREPLPADYFGTLRLERARAHLARARDRFPGWETLDIWLAEALWLALAGCAAESRNILQAIPQDSRFSQGSFDYDLKFIAHWIEAASAGKPFTAV